MKKYRVRSALRTPATHKRMARYVPTEGDEGVVTDALALSDAVQTVLGESGYVVVTIEDTEETHA